MSRYGQKTKLYINNLDIISTIEDSLGNIFEVHPNATLTALSGAHFTRQKFAGVTNWIKF